MTPLVNALKGVGALPGARLDPIMGIGPRHIRTAHTA
ncbi:MAG: hypothetical protein JWR74_2241 [Polaromonas sp.]|nr:hypothetical protein [Polaromonas sp.]